MQPAYFFEKDYFNRLQNKIKTHIKIALFLDFDGTLVPIQKNPAQCFLPEKIKEQLRSLTRSDHCYLSVLSGRSLSDIKKRVGIRRIYYGGNHGLDISGPNIKYTHLKVVLAKPIIDIAKRKLGKEIRDIDGAWLEDKKYTLSLHFRSVKKEDIFSVKKNFYKAVAELSDKKPLAVIKGKKVLELVPNVSWDKGSAALWILKKLKVKCLPIYIGDDQTDENVFKALHKKGINIRVGKSKKTLADYYLKGYWEISRLLKQIQEIIKTL
jgi:trehalose-phosphatase